MPHHTQQSQHTFVIRFWWERGRGDSGREMGWRGRIEHVQSGEGMTFQEVHQLLVFIEGFLAPLSSLTKDQGSG